jgi:uridine nucleosidase
MAIILAASHPSIELIGISTVHGNSSIDNVTKNALGLLKATGITGVDVYKGIGHPIVREPYIPDHFHGEDGFGSIILPETT